MTKYFFSVSFDQRFATFVRSLFSGACVAALLLLAGCGEPVDTRTAADDRQSTGEPNPGMSDELQVTRGETGRPADPETQGAGGMFEADPGDPGQRNTYAAGATGDERKPIPTEEWTGESFGQPHESAYVATKEKEVAREVVDQAEVRRLAGSDLEQRVRQDLRQASGELGLSQAQIENVRISVNNEQVRLTGEVPSQEAVQQIEQRVSQVPGVGAMVNELQIRATAE